MHIIVRKTCSVACMHHNTYIHTCIQTQASNQGALIMKILSERCDTVPARYSANLRAVVGACLTKDVSIRPFTWQLLSHKEISAHARDLGIQIPSSVVRYMSVCMLVRM